MEDDDISSTGFKPLFIKEEDADPGGTLSEQGLAFTGTRLHQSTLIKPYLQEMDELLKSCEELIGVPFGSRFSAGYDETSLTESTHSHRKEEDSMESYGETSASNQAYLSTSYIDTHMDGAGSEDQPVQGQEQGVERCVVTAGASGRKEMPLTSAGNRLSDTMVEYEGRLSGMLAMLEGCTEESGMDFESQGWATEASQEYVHISKNLCRGDTVVPIQQGRSMTMETQTMHAGGDEASETGDSATGGGRQNAALSCDNMGGFLMETLEWRDQGVLDPRFEFLGPSMQSDGTENDPMCCEATKTGYASTYAKGAEVDDAELPAEEREELKMDTADPGSDLNELGSQMERCVEEVQRLETRRKELLTEVLELRSNKHRGEAEGSNGEEAEEGINSRTVELMKVLRREEEERREERKREIQSLREERAGEERMLWKVNLERQGLHEELRSLKRRLFAMARDCARNQAALNAQQREVELLKRDEEKMQALVLQLTEEGSRLRAAQQQGLSDLRARHQARSSSQTSSTQDELTQCKRHSCGDIQQYLQGGLKALEDRYEPILLTLLKRRDATSGALAKAKEQAQELRAQLRPLKEEVQKLNLQRACLEEKLKLIYLQRREDAGQYKETVYFLEDRSRELKAELKMQKRQTKEIEELRDSLTKQLHLFRAAIEDHKTCDGKEKT